MKTKVSTFASRTRLIASVTLTLLVAFGALIADTVSKQRDATTNVTLEICKKGANGQWDIIDRAKAPANFTASVMDLASGKELTSNVNWSAKTEKGTALNVKLGRGVKVNLNPQRGLLELDTPFEISVNGKKMMLVTKLTTESISTPIGQLVGKRADLNIQAKTLTAGVVGFGSTKQRDVIDEILRGVESKGKAATVGGTRAVDELIVVIKGDGRVVAK